MIPNDRALVPVNPFQQAATLAIYAVEQRQATGKRMLKYPYARELIRCLTDETALTAHAVSRAASNYRYQERQLPGMTKADFLAALDTLLESRGEHCPLPLDGDATKLYFPETRFRHRSRRHKAWDRDIDCRKRQAQKEQARLTRRYQAQVAQAEIDLAFTTPAQLPAWYRRWKHIHDWDLEAAVLAWGERFTALHDGPALHNIQPLWNFIERNGPGLESRSPRQQELDGIAIPNKLRLIIDTRNSENA